MTPWYQSNQRLFREERESLAKATDLMWMAVVNQDFRLNNVTVLRQESVVACGTYEIPLPDWDKQLEYRVSILFPYRYPKHIPALFCNDPKLPIGNIDRHIMPDGNTCLGVHADIMARWVKSSNIVSFLENFVAPFLVWQAYYDVHQCPPSWGERAHFGQGIIEYYSELLNLEHPEIVIEFMKLLARKNRPKGHELCPCGSGNRLRNCHCQLLYKTREKLKWEYVVEDLRAVIR
jgi:hypothetical protein